MKKIDNIKYQVKQLIQESLYWEVTPETKHNIAGIYMIYIDNFTSEKIVPIYIGQSKDIQRRYKQHFSEIIALNRLSYDEYNKYFFSKNSSFYEGKLKSCKIFKYMLENNCTLLDFRMVILEEVEEEDLDEKEQEYFQRLLPSFFGFNQLNSFIKQLKFRFSNSQMNNSEKDDYLNILLEDVKGIYSYYENGFTRFNFEHSIPRDIAHLLKENEQLNSNTLSKYDEVKLNLDELFKLYKLDIQNRGIQKLNEKVGKTLEEYNIAKAELDEMVNQQGKEIAQKFNEKIGIFEKNIKNNKLLVEKKFEVFQSTDVLRKESIKEIRHERYKLIFPICQFESFSLRDRSNNPTIKINEDNDLLNTCHIQIYISNNGVSRGDTRKESNIIMIDSCFIDYEENKFENRYYIDNQTTIICQSGIEYIEKDFNNIFAMKRERFSISSVRDNEIDNSFISVQAEYKHGINDYTLEDKQLVKLSSVLDEIQQITDDDTGFNIGASESYRCIEMCMINEGLQNNPLVEKLLAKKLPKIKKKRKSSIKVVDNSNELKIDATVKRAEAYKQKVLKKSDNTVKVLKYVSSRKKVTAQCMICDYKWEIRSDHLLKRPHCPFCKNTTNK
ncbi:excinuclease ABC subunit C [Psychrobacillus sp. FSL K6-1415]|uniref:excinuclease ABC subunit C n=1 Tax=Psychrobacillus sp. FSL K6-1415 TaxID=2921544 RepID=UPI0030FADCA9